MESSWVFLESCPGSFLPECVCVCMYVCVYVCVCVCYWDSEYTWELVEWERMCLCVGVGIWTHAYGPVCKCS